MATKNKSNPAKNTTCSVCNIEAHAIPGTKHRRCGGSAKAPVRGKRAPKATVQGTWG